MNPLRRDFLKTGLALGTGALLSRLTNVASAQGNQTQGSHDMSTMTVSATAAPMKHGNNMTVGKVDPATNGFDPMQILVDWDYGTVSTLANGQTLREYTITAVDKEIEIVPGIFFPAWTYNGRVPGPTIRATEGDRLRINFVNGGSHPHTIHFHGIHPAEMDGTALPENGGEVQPGEIFTYEFDAEPFGCHLYHCHAVSLKRHIHKGLYGAFIIDPKEGRPPAREFMMMMNAFDTNFDGGNEVYAVNTVGFEFANRPIPLQVGELVRIYLVNILEFDPLNSFHLHANFFDYYDHGTTLTPTLKKVDTISQVQGQRGILEFRYKFPGKFMFHPHVSEFTELGWMGLFNVVKPEDYAAALSAVGLDSSWDERALKGSTVAWKGRGDS
jgi:manganese oxidase